MSRIARHLSGPGALCPGTLYHITSRGVDHTNIFDSTADRVVFLSLLADVCLELGLVVHAFCLMTNHVHLLVEDSRGLVSQAMSRVLGPYAQYFNLTRPVPRSGHLFAGRFFSEIVDSPTYYDRLAAYILCNPMRTGTPMAASVKDYPWSSARVTLDEQPDRMWETWLEGFGGVDSMMAAAPGAQSPEAKQNRKRRFERLASSEWFNAEAARCGRTIDEYGAYLQSRIGKPKPETLEPPENVETAETGTDAAETEKVEALRAASMTANARVREIPRVAAKWQGVELPERFEEISEACGRFFAGDSRQMFGDLLCYALYRFAAASASRIAHAVGRVSEGFYGAIRRVRALRTSNRAWTSLLWSIEWHLRWQLRAGPWRE